MFKLRRTAVRRCRENRRFGERSRNERIKFEGNSNITSNRVTIPPNFLCHKLRSRKIQKSPFKFRLGYDSGADVVFADRLDLNENYHKPRRSARISKKTEEARNYTQQTASEYYYNCLQDSPEVETTKKTSGIARNNSNSLFREINERCSRLKPKKTLVDFNYPVSAVIDPHSKVERFYPSIFCVNLFREVILDLKSHDYLSTSKRAISEKIWDINRQLLGKMNVRQGNPERTEQIEAEEQQNDFNYIPRSAWVFQTPPRQRVVLPKPAESAIRPAVICTANKRNNLYELHPSYHVDLTGVSSGENVELNGRYMRRLASFEENGEPVRGFGMETIQEGYSDSRSTVSNLFAQVMGRPAKTVKAKSRTGKFYERTGRDGLEDTPTGVNLFQSIEEFDRDVTFVEDNGTFTLVSTQASERESFEFKFRKNLFKVDDEKMFNFDTEEPKMFNFAKLEGN